MSIKIFPLILSIAIVSACGQRDTQEADSKPNEFDVFCEQFTKLTLKKEFEDLTPEERSTLLDQEFSTKVSRDSNAYIAWSAIRSATPSDRAQLYHDAAKSAGSNDWECAAVNNFAAQVGSN